MKIQALFDMLRASQDLLSNFDNVSTAPQLVSRLDALKRPMPEDLLADLENLRDAVDEMLSDTLETSGTLADEGESPDALAGALDAFPELDSLEEEPRQDATGNTSPVLKDSKDESQAS